MARPTPEPEEAPARLRLIAQVAPGQYDRIERGELRLLAGAVIEVEIVERAPEDPRRSGARAGLIEALSTRMAHETGVVDDGAPILVLLKDREEQHGDADD